MATGTIYPPHYMEREYIKTISSSSSAVITFTGTVRMVLFISSGATARQAALLVTGSTGTPVVSDLYKGSNISYTTATGTLTITTSSSSSSFVYALILNDTANLFTVA